MAKMVIVNGILLLVSTATWVSAQELKPLTPVLEEEWWGPGEESTQDKSIRPYTVTLEKSMIEDLKDRLMYHREVTPPLDGIGFQYGFNSDELASWVEYWLNDYNFTQREEYFNKYPHYKTNIQGLDIHFVWIKPEAPEGVKVVPIIVMHGRPGSVFEFYDSVPMLTTPQEGYDYVFEMIIPSLPSYGFSDSPVKPGAASPQFAVILKNLMLRLGHEHFYVQGGDWGSLVGSAMCTLFPDHVLGFHSNLLIVQNSCSEVKMLTKVMVASTQLTSPEAAKIPNLSLFLEGSGHNHVQATKPETLGACLTDSAIGFLAYMIEKIAFLTNPTLITEKDSGLARRFTKDQILDLVMVYWSTNTITTSMRIYSAYFSNENRAFAIDDYPSFVPTWSVEAKNEYLTMTRSALKYPFLIGTTIIEDAGHFLAMEQPEIFAKDVLKGVQAIMDFRETKAACEYSK